MYTYTQAFSLSLSPLLIKICYKNGRIITEQWNGIAIRGLACFSCIPVKDKSNFKAEIV